MICKQTTKDLLAESAFELLKTKSMDQITVQNIIDNCGVSRKTFYNHFIDKQDLFEWTYSRDVLSRFFNLSPSYPLGTAILDTLLYLKNNIHFFSKLRGEKLISVYKENFRNTMTEQLKLLGIELNSELLFIIDYTGFAQVSMVNRWIGNGTKESPEEIVRLLLECLPEKLKVIFAEYQLL